MINRRSFIKQTLLLTAGSSLVLNNALHANNTTSILNRKNRISTPLLKNKAGEFKKITWKKAFDIMQEKISNNINTQGVNGIGLYTSANIDIIESYALSKLFKAGFRSNNILTSSFKNNDIHDKSRLLVYGIDGTSGTLYDINKSDVLLSFDVNTNDKKMSVYIKANKNLKIININTKNEIYDDAYLNISIKQSSYNLIIRYIIRELLYNNTDKMQWDYIKKHTIFSNYKENKQWEISFNDYKKSFKKYTLDYVTDTIKYNPKESKADFKNKLTKLKDLALNKSIKLISLTSNEFNESNNSMDSNLLVQSLHILLNKHSRPGCGVFNISHKISDYSVSGVGINANRLPSNMFIKYNEHRKIAEDFWDVPRQTLNAISNENLKENIKNNITKFLWINGNDANDSYNNINNKIYDIGKNKDIFIVNSCSYFDDTSYNSDLLLPTAIMDERININGNEQRQIKYNSQKNIAYGNSMSLLWQTIELSKRFSIKDSYGYNKINNKNALKNVIIGFLELGYKPQDSLYKVLFYNGKTRLFPKETSFLNSESNGDSRLIIGSDGGLFNGYKYNMQKYLFEEFREFTLNNAHDLASFNIYKNSKRELLWPYINNKEIEYRFNPIDDIYALKSSEPHMNYSFYGRMGNKSLKFGNLEKVSNEEKKSLKYRAKIFTTTN